MGHCLPFPPLHMLQLGLGPKYWKGTFLNQQPMIASRNMVVRIYGCLPHRTSAGTGLWLTLHRFSNWTGPGTAHWLAFPRETDSLDITTMYHCACLPSNHQAMHVLQKDIAEWGRVDAWTIRGLCAPAAFCLPAWSYVPLGHFSLLVWFSP